MNKRIILFQKNLRKPVKQFSQLLSDFEFVNMYPQFQDSATYKNLPSFKQEMQRRKDGIINKIRRIFGILNVRFMFMKDGDLLFSYSYLLITNKPYVVFIENGLAIYGFDRRIAKHPVTKFIFAFLVRRKNLKKMVFMSKTSQKSFLNSANYSKDTKKIVESKSTHCYPAIKTDSLFQPKKISSEIRLLFVGLFYMKGGIELVNAFERITSKYSNTSLTIITAKHLLNKQDQEKMLRIPSLKLLDANLNESQIYQMYATHDIFVLPTFRDSCPSVLQEALSYGMPMIVNDHYATVEAAIDGYNGFVNPNHPMKDYVPETYEMLGQYFNPKDFYTKLFNLQKEGKTKMVEDFIYNSIEKFILNPEILEKFSRNSLKLYNNEFHYEVGSKRMESIFLEAIEK